jgi:phospholipid/cholesterol/gamma-HCH transport system substrate-binding protein
MPESGRTRELSVGAVVSVGLVIFAIAVLAVSKESRMFVPKVRYWSRFSNTSGLATGSPVRLVGVQVGTVESIEFPKELSENRIKVVFSVDRSFAPRIRAGTVAYLKSMSYLSGDKYVELTPGDPEQQQLESGGYIEAGISVWESTLLQSQSITDDVKEITASLKDLLVALNRGEGLIQEMIHDPEFGRKGAADLEGSLASLRRILQGVEAGDGLAGALLSKESYSRKQLDTIDASLTHLSSVLERLDSAEGPFAQMTDPKGKGAEVLENMRQASSSLSRVAQQAGEGRGLAGRLLNDEKYAESLLGKIDRVAGHAESILKKIDGGQGSLGGLVNDPEVYQSLKDIVAGIQKSRMGKGVVRHYGKKGAKAREGEGETGPVEEEPPPPPPPNP